MDKMVWEWNFSFYHRDRSYWLSNWKRFLNWHTNLSVVLLKYFSKRFSELPLRGAMYHGQPWALSCQLLLATAWRKLFGLCTEIPNERIQTRLNLLSWCVYFLCLQFKEESNSSICLTEWNKLGCGRWLKKRGMEAILLVTQLALIL